MKKIVKRSLVGLGIVVAISATAMAYLYFSFRANQPQFFEEPVFETVPPEISLPAAGPSILVFSKTSEFRHKAAIPAAIDMFKQVAEKNGWSIFVTENAAVFNPEQLAMFDVVVGNNTTGSALTEKQRLAFQAFVTNGGGYVAIHSAGDKSHSDWAWYQQQVIRAEFIGHTLFPQKHIQSATIRTEDRAHPVTRHLPASWNHEDEWYSFASSPRDAGVHVLATVDETSYEPGRIAMGEDHPVIWTHEIGRGRVFYTALGHLGKNFADPRHRELLEQAVKWTGRLATARPNVVFILTDDQRADAVGFHPDPLLGIDTPNIDRLAAEGAVFSNMFVTSSLCSPSRASFLSGTYAHTHGVRDNFTDYPAELQSFPMVLQQAGYQTAWIGKWHMGEDDDSKRPGFDYWITHKGQGKYYDTTFNIDGERRLVEGYYSHEITDMAIEWLESRDRRKPFALVLGHKAPHGPFVPEQKYQGTYDHLPVPYPSSAFQLESKPDWVKDRLPTWHGIYGPLYGFRKNFPDDRPEAVSDFERFVRSYTATINSVDDSVGRIYQALESAGILDDTIFVFSSDNGFLLGEHGMIDKRTMHEESIRVPMVVRYPKTIAPATVVTEQVLSIDLAPSLVELTGTGELENAQGRSWARLVSGRSSEWREAWLYEYNYEKQFPYTPNVRGVRTDNWKYVQYPHGDGGPLRHIEELYQLDRDPAELNNLAKDPAYASQLGNMRELLARTLADTDALPDKMPIDEGIKSALPEEKIR